MKRAFSLAVVLRAREAQEKVAKGVLAQANAQVSAAEHDVSARTATLQACSAMTDGSAAAFVASMTLRSALAGELADAELGKSYADQAAAERAAEWTGAAIKRRALERLEELHAEAVSTEEMRVSQMEIDESAGRPAIRREQA